jgi:hypothetical protein
MLCGFRQGKSPLDHLFRFETFIRNALATKKKEKKGTCRGYLIRS